MLDRVLGTELDASATGANAEEGLGRTLGAALIELRRSFVEQRVHRKRQVELLDVERLEAGLQRAAGVGIRSCSPPPPPAALALLALPLACRTKCKQLQVRAGQPHLPRSQSAVD